MIKAHWRSALILAIGLLAGFSARSLAVADDQIAPAPSTAPQADMPTQSSSPLQASPAPQSNSATQPATADDDAAAPVPPQSSGQRPTQATPAPPRAPAVAGGSGYTLWKDTSLIGKIFIGVGALLTIASAARMFMA